MRALEWNPSFGPVVTALIVLGAGLLMQKLLFGVRSWDLATLFGVTAVLAAAATMASWLPARRAASVNPVEALRAE